MIDVFLHMDFTKGATLVGTLAYEALRGREVFSFKFDEEWLQSYGNLLLDPSLGNYEGWQYLSEDKDNFGIFLDSSPDRWGRMLIKRREAIEAKEQKRKIKRLSEIDYLLGINDLTRLGALRLRNLESDQFLAFDSLYSTPPITSLGEIEMAVAKIENDEVEGTEAKKWLSMLLQPGSSLGGARPKSNFIDKKKELWIAKFPSQSDYFNIGGWEYICAILAKELYINTPQFAIKKFASDQYTFLSKRFDRDLDNRIHFASAMCLLGLQDGTNYVDGVSYLDLVSILEQHGADPDADVRQLWQRIVFSVAVSNTDDHLRNHGFLLSPHGWRLSPAYDINPNQSAIGLTLNISETDNALDYDLCLSVCSLYRWKKDEAMMYIKKVKKTVSQWRAIAKKIKLKSNEIEDMSPAFNY